MTIRELIQELEKIENKDIEITMLADGGAYGIETVSIGEWINTHDEKVLICELNGEE